jgi:hypothetical protein
VPGPRGQVLRLDVVHQRKERVVVLVVRHGLLLLRGSPLGLRERRVDRRRSTPATTAAGGGARALLLPASPTRRSRSPARARAQRRMVRAQDQERKTRAGGDLLGDFKSVMIAPGARSCASPPNRIATKARCVCQAEVGMGKGNQARSTARAFKRKRGGSRERVRRSAEQGLWWSGDVSRACMRREGGVCGWFVMRTRATSATKVTCRGGAVCSVVRVLDGNGRRRASDSARYMMSATPLLSPRKHTRDIFVTKPTSS